jgi:hypothetical protein
MDQETTMENVKAQLMYEWDEQENDEGEVVTVKGKQLMTEEEAMQMIRDHIAILTRGKVMRSYAYYTANQIRKAAGNLQQSEPGL